MDGHHILNRSLWAFCTHKRPLNIFERSFFVMRMLWHFQKISGVFFFLFFKENKNILYTMCELIIFCVDSILWKITLILEFSISSRICNSEKGTSIISPSGLSKILMILLMWRRLCDLISSKTYTTMYPPSNALCSNISFIQDFLRLILWVQTDGLP